MERVIEPADCNCITPPKIDFTLIRLEVRALSKVLRDSSQQDSTDDVAFLRQTVGELASG